MKNEFALLVLESPWWSPRENPLRASCLPFFSGLERLYDGFNIYYSTFYDTAGFETALAQDLIHTNEKRQVLYIGAHGSHKSIADGRASAVLSKVGLYGKRIAGIIISSCNVACKEENLLRVFETSKVNWVFGYTKSVDWLSSLLLEVTLVAALVGTNDDDDENEERLLECFGTALHKFNPYTPIGSNQEPLFECIRLYQRAKYKRDAVDLTSTLITHTWGDLSGEES